MDLFTKEDLRTLTEISESRCVSIYMPVHQKGREIQADPIRLKNLIDEAERQLIAGGHRLPEARELLEPAGDLLSNGFFWQHQSEGLALFLTPQFFRAYRLPSAFETMAVVANRFHVKPLLPLLSGDGQFYILALSQNQVRLLYGTRYSVDKIDLDEVPSGIAQALRYDDPEKQLQFHTGTGGAGGAGHRPAQFHGQGSGANDQDARLLHYFSMVDKEVHRLLRDEHAPLVLAGVDYLLPIYAQANTYPHLLGKGIEGNPDDLGAQVLHQRAWAIVEPRFVAARRESEARYKQLAGRGSAQACNNLEDVIAAAYYGRVETLFVALGVQRWGFFEPGANAVHLEHQAHPDNQDLLDLAAVQTLLNGGMVYAVDPDEVPGGGIVAAVLRY